MKLLGVDLNEDPSLPGVWMGASAGLTVLEERWSGGVSIQVITGADPNASQICGVGATFTDAFIALRRNLEEQEVNLASLRRVLEAGA